MTMVTTTFRGEEVIIIARILSNKDFGSGVGYVTMFTHGEYRAELHDSKHFNLSRDQIVKLPTIQGNF
jgi:hypothetical protein